MFGNISLVIPVVAYVVGFLLSVCIAVSVDVWVRRHGHGTAVRWARLALYCTVVWSLGSLLQLVVVDETAKIAIFQLWAVASWGVPLCWFFFVVYYTDSRRFMTRRVRLSIGAVFASLVGLTLTNHLHGLLWERMRLVTGEYAIPVLTAKRTAVYWAGFAFLFGLTLLSFLLLVKLFVTARRVSRSQVGALTLGMVAPVLASLLSGSADQYATALNLIPVGAAICLLFVGWALFRYQLFGIAPQARDEVLEVIDDGVVVVNDEGLVVDYNARATSLFPDLDSAFGDPISTAAPSLVATPDATGPARFADALTVPTAAGDRSVQVSVSALTVQGKRRASVVVLQNVTELQGYARELEQRTEQLDRFAETVSHDLRNPLSVLQGHLELMAATGDTSTLEEATAAANRMSDIIDDVLTLARQGRSVEDPTPTSLVRVAEEAWRTTDAPTVSLDVSVPEDCSIRADEARLRTALENLFRNVADHATNSAATDPSATTPTDGGASVSLTVTRTESGFAVADDGPGIPPAERDTIFDHGFTTAENGTGFGLAIVKEIADAHGWSVNVTDSPSGGAQFTFEDVIFVEN
ncbi:MAG: histidine kinase N-terminal 7TM domain-containing protein [Halorientalis sp.]